VEDSSEANHCHPSRSALSTFFKELTQDLGQKEMEKGSILTCRQDSLTLKESATGEIKLLKAKSLLPGSVEAQIAKPSDGSVEASPRLHILMGNKSVVRFNPQTDQVETRFLPSAEVREDTKPEFSEDAKSVNIGNGTQVDLDELFREPTPSNSETSIPHELNPAPTRFAPIDFQPVRSPGRFQDLLVYDSETKSLNRFPLFWSREVEIVGEGPRTKEVFISGDGKFAVTYSGDGKARYWERRTVIPLNAGSSPASTKDSGELEANQIKIKADALDTADSSQAKTSGKTAELGGHSSKEKARELADEILDRIPLSLRSLHSADSKNQPAEDPDLARAIELLSGTDFESSLNDSQLTQMDESRITKNETFESGSLASNNLALASIDQTRENAMKYFELNSEGHAQTGSKDRAEDSSDPSTNTNPKNSKITLEWIFIFPEGWKPITRRRRDSGQSV